MLFNKKNSDSIDYKKVNDIFSILSKILKIGYVLAIVIAIYAITILTKEWKILDFIYTLVGIISPLFIGLIIAWLFDPIVKWFTKKGLKRFVGAAITYVVFIGALSLVVGALIPVLSEQLNDFAKTIPSLMDSMTDELEGVFTYLETIENIDVSGIRNNIYTEIEGVGSTLATSIPTKALNIITSFFSSISTFLIGLIIGFYLLVSLESPETLINFLPRKIRTVANELMGEVNGSFRSYIQGAILDSTFVFIISSIGLWIVGLRAPLLFALFCGITNVIPYAGPYIGGIPAVIVGFSQSPTIGILTLVVIGVIQLLEGNFIQPVIMSKTTKLHPVTIIIGLLVFGHFWGIIGMVISTPLIASIKAIVLFFNKKYGILSYDGEEQNLDIENEELRKVE